MFYYALVRRSTVEEVPQAVAGPMVWLVLSGRKSKRIDAPTSSPDESWCFCLLARVVSGDRVRERGGAGVAEADPEAEVKWKG